MPHSLCHIATIRGSPDRMIVDRRCGNFSLFASRSCLNARFWNLASVDCKRPWSLTLCLFEGVERLVEI